MKIVYCVDFRNEINLLIIQKVSEQHNLDKISSKSSKCQMSIDDDIHIDKYCTISTDIAQYYQTFSNMTNIDIQAGAELCQAQIGLS